MIVMVDGEALYIIAPPRRPRRGAPIRRMARRLPASQNLKQLLFIDLEKEMAQITADEKDTRAEYKAVMAEAASADASLLPHFEVSIVYPFTTTPDHSWARVFLNCHDS